MKMVDLYSTMVDTKLVTQCFVGREYATQTIRLEKLLTSGHRSRGANLLIPEVQNAGLIYWGLELLLC